MVIRFKSYIALFRIKFRSFLEDLVGSRGDFTIKNYYLNVSCLVLAIMFFATILIDIILQINITELKISRIITEAGLVIVFIISRFSWYPGFAKFLFSTIVLASFSFEWFFTGGTSGIMIFLYFRLFALLFLFSSKRYQTIVLISILLNVSLLFYMEYKYPHLMVNSIPDQKIFIYKYLYSVFTLIFLSFIIQITKALHWAGENNSTKHNGNGFINGNYQKKIEKIRFILTLREREVFDLKVKGMPNKEIAYLLHVDISTVKTHINNIKKKIWGNSLL